MKWESPSEWSVTIKRHKYYMMWKSIFKHCTTFINLHLSYKELEDTNRLIGIRISKKNRQNNGQMKSTKGQTTIYKTYTYKTKERVTRNPLKTGGELMCSGRVSSSCSTSGTRRVNLVTNPVINHKRRKERRSVYDKWNISAVICDTDIPQRSMYLANWLDTN